MLNSKKLNYLLHIIHLVKETSMFCKICYDAKKPEAEYTSHNIRMNGQVTCPILKNIRCHHCYGRGHTTSYCKKRKQVKSPFQPRSQPRNQERSQPRNQERSQPRSQKRRRSGHDCSSSYRNRISSGRFNMLSEMEAEIEAEMGPEMGPSPVIPHVSSWDSSFVDIVKTSLNEIKREMKEIKKEMKEVVPPPETPSPATTSPATPPPAKLSWADMMDEEEEEEECELVSAY